MEYFVYFCHNANQQSRNMLNELKQKIREVVGEGKLYEAHISYGELSYIFTKEKDFEVDWTLYYFWGDVTDRNDSPIVRKIHEIFGCEVKILGFCDYYSHLYPEKVCFKKLDKESGVQDTECTYIVCTTGRKGKLTRWNLQEEQIEIV